MLKKAFQTKSSKSYLLIFILVLAPDFVNFFKNVSTPDEIFFQTIIMN